MGEGEWEWDVACEVELGEEIHMPASRYVEAPCDVDLNQTW